MIRRGFCALWLPWSSSSTLECSHATRGIVTGSRGRGGGSETERRLSFVSYAQLKLSSRPGHAGRPQLSRGRLSCLNFRFTCKKG